MSGKSKPGTLNSTPEPLTSGDEPIELLRQLAFEYLAELESKGECEFLACEGKEGQPVLLAVIPNAKIADGKIVSVGSVGTGEK